MTESLGNAVQTRIIAEQVAEAVLIKYAASHSEAPEAKIPAPLKWAGVIASGLFTAGTATLAFWLVSTVSQMQVTLARMDERMVSGTMKDNRVDEIDRRLVKLESVGANP